MDAYLSKNDLNILFTSILSIGLFLRIVLGNIINILIIEDEVFIGYSNIIIWSNILIILSLLSLTTNSDNLNVLFYPSVAIISILLYEIYVTYKFFDRINNNNIPDIIHKLNIWLNIIYLFISILVYKVYVTDNNELIKQYTYMFYILVILNLLICHIQYTIMNYYMVDVKK